MTVQTAWLLAILAAVVTAAIGFFVGRRFGSSKERIADLEAEVKRQQEQSDEYRKEVAAHFDKTASLFVSMAGSYKEMFEHLSSGYEKLSSGSSREMLQQRVDVLLVGDGRESRADGKAASAAGVAAAATAAAAVDQVGPGGPVEPVEPVGSVVSEAGPVTVDVDKSGADPTAAVGVIDGDEDANVAAGSVDGQAAAMAADSVGSDTAPRASETLTGSEVTATKGIAESDEVQVESPVAASTEVTAATEPVSDTAPEPRTDQSRNDEPRTEAVRREALAPAGDPLAEEVIGHDRATPRNVTG